MESLDWIRVKIEVITSFNKRYYDLIGHACVSSWLQYWPQDLVLTCYVENIELPTNARLKQIPFSQLGKQYQEFQDSDQGDRVKTFAKKAYCVMHAMEHSTADRIYWIDADVITKQPVPLTLLENLCGPNELAAYMGVHHDSWYSAETGIFVVNSQHELFGDFAKKYRERYDKHITHDLRRFYDGEVFGAVAKEFSSRAKLNDLCSSFSKPYRTPLRHTELGTYFHHHKSKHAKADFSAQDQ